MNIKKSNIEYLDPQAVKSLPLKIDDEFVRAKRNLFWICSAAVLLVFATNFGENTDCVKFSLLGGFSFQPAHIALLLLPYIFYLGYMYWYQLSRVQKMNSPIFQRDVSKSTFEVIEEIQNELNNIRETFVESLRINSGIVGDIARIEFESQNDEEFPKGEVGILRTRVSNLKDISNTIDQSEIKAINTGKLTPSGSSKELQNRIELREKFFGEIDNLFIEIGQQYAKLSKMTEWSQPFEQLPDNIKNARVVLRRIDDSVTGLSDEILKADRQKYLISDIVVPVVFSVLSFAALITISIHGFSNTEVVSLGSCTASVSTTETSLNDGFKQS